MLINLQALKIQAPYKQGENGNSKTKRARERESVREEMWREHRPPIGADSAYCAELVDGSEFKQDCIEITGRKKSLECNKGAKIEREGVWNIT